MDNAICEEDFHDNPDDVEPNDYDVTHASSSRDGSYAPILSPMPMENPKENDWCQVEKQPLKNETKLEPVSGIG